jgi:hypothetical protein
MKQTQREWTIQQLKENGFVTRNQALSVFFSRLGAVICDLKAEGWEIEGKKDGRDYKYTLLKPKTRLVYEFILKEGIRIPVRKYVEI